MQTPANPAAEVIQQARSVLVDLNIQAGEIQAAIAKQNAIITSLAGVAEWEESPDPQPVPELDPSPAE